MFISKKHEYSLWDDKIPNKDNGPDAIKDARRLCFISEICAMKELTIQEL